MKKYNNTVVKHSGFELLQVRTIHDYVVLKKLNVSNDNNYVIGWMASYKDDYVGFAKVYEDMSLKIVKKFFDNLGMIYLED